MRKYTKAESETVFLDTTILVHSHNLSSPHYEKASAIRSKVCHGEMSASISPQILMEFFAVITNPKRVTSPLSPELAIAEVKKYYELGTLRKIFPLPSTPLRVFDIVCKYNLKRAEIFDAQIAATMLDNGIKTIYTQNIRHFRRFEEIESLDPFA